MASGRLSSQAAMNQFIDRALSFLISAGIAAFGVWTIAFTRGSESPLVWMLLGTLPIVVGLISLYQAIAEARNA